MKDVCEAYPQKTRHISLASVNTQGLTDDKINLLATECDNLIAMGWQEKEILEELNLWADDLRTQTVKTSQVYEQQMTERSRIMKQVSEERKDMPIPTPNLEGDVGMKRLKAFLNWLNDTSAGVWDDYDSISEVQMLHGIQAQWTDVVDIPMTEYYFDVLAPLKIYIIGGGEAKQADDGFWFFAG